MIRCIAVINDLHCGSTCGLLPPGFVTHEGNEVKLNGAQSWLWECWSDMRDKWLPRIVGKDEFALVLNGDLVEGIHHGTKQVISPDKKDHSEAAYQVLAPLCGTLKKLDEDLKPAPVRASRVFVTEGTECHTGNDEATIAKRLNATPEPGTKKGAWPQLRITIAGCRCVFRHHITTAIRTYLEASGLGIHLNQEQLEAAKNQEMLPRVLCCAHRHRYGEFKDASGLCVVVPPWELLTRHGHKVVPAARTRPGAVVLDWRNRENGELPETHAIAYRPPEPSGVTL